MPRPASPSPEVVRDAVRAAMTRDELLALPASVPLDIGNRAIGIGRTTGYDLAKRGDYPCRVLRIGNQYRVITEDLLRVLEIDVKPRDAA